MNKRKALIINLICVLICAMLLCGCDTCKHNWVEATCEEPMTCSICGKTEGEPLGHDWTEATCETPRTCIRCNVTEGEAPGHSWIAATCMHPMTCSVCGETSGDIAEHTWIAATCVQPRHCSVCGLIDGIAAPHTWVSASYDSPRTCSVCGVTEGQALVPFVSGSKEFTFSLVQGAEQDYQTITGYDDRIATGTVSVVGYNKFYSDASHPGKEGYEWREVSLEFRMDKPCRVMWGYTDSYAGLDEYALSDYITFSDGTREKVAVTKTFSTATVTPSANPQASDTPTPTPTEAPTQAPSQSSDATATPGAESSTAMVAPAVTPTPTPSPTPDSEPGKYISYVTEAIQVPTSYNALIFYVCNADYEKDHMVDNSFKYMQMN